MAIFMSSHQYPQIEEFLQSLQFEKKYSQHTLTAYRIDLAQFAAYLKTEYDSPSIKDIKTVFIRSWLADIKSRELSNTSINRKISALKSFFRYLLKLGSIETSPVAGILSPKISKKLPFFIDEKDVKKLAEDVVFPDTHLGKTEKLILTLLYTTGMRLSELINLKEKNIDYSYSTINVLGKGNKERLIPTSASLLQSIKEYISNKPVSKENIDNVFTNEKGKPFNPKTVYNSVRKYLTEVTLIEKKSPHILRHTFATHLMNNGAEMNAVKELLGHSSLASTQVYTHLTIEKLKEVYKQAHPKA